MDEWKPSSKSGLKFLKSWRGRVLFNGEHWSETVVSNSPGNLTWPWAERVSAAYLKTRGYAQCPVTEPARGGSHSARRRVVAVQRVLWSKSSQLNLGSRIGSSQPFSNSPNMFYSLWAGFRELLGKILSRACLWREERSVASIPMPVYKDCLFYGSTTLKQNMENNHLPDKGKTQLTEPTCTLDPFCADGLHG